MSASSADPVRQRPNRELLGILIGEDTADQWADRALADVFSLRPSGDCSIHEGEAAYRAATVIEAAKELVARALVEELRQTDCLSAPAKIRDLLRLRFADLQHEVFVVLLLDAQNHLIEVVELFRGTLTQTAVYPREVVKLALGRNAAAVVFAHNHPSGFAEPSAADELLTRTLKEALSLVDVRVLDHFIVGASVSPVSFAERGLV